MTFSYREELDKINSATKYPSIETYHRLERGRPQPEIQVPLDGEDIIITEKIDGTNARIIIFQDFINVIGRRFLIGSREDLLYYSGDLLYNPAQSIVDGSIKAAIKSSSVLPEGCTYVFFGEVYGSRNITKSSHFYSKSGSEVGFRLFDAIEFTQQEFFDIFKHSCEELASWREHGGQTFVSEERLHQLAPYLGVQITPRLSTKIPPPVGITETHEWLKQTLTASQAILGEQGKGRPEGVVIRTANRSKITKIKFEDYERASQ